MEYTHFVSVAALVFNDAGKILLIDHPHRGWEYPGGMVEPHETLHTALLREIKEETGVDAEITGFAGISKNVERDIVNIDFICRYIGGDLRTSEESKEVKWVDRKAAFEMVQYPLTQKRLANMLACQTPMYCFGFRKEPFATIDEEWFSVGTASGFKVQ